MADSIDVFDFVVNRGNGVKGLANTCSLQTLPPQYILPTHQRFDKTKVVSHSQEDDSSSSSSIPIIDFSNHEDEEVRRSICEAASKWGFFQIINHGIPQEVMEKVKDAAHGFFGLPNEERSKYCKGVSPSDTVFLATSFSPKAEVALEWKDFLSFLYVSGDDQASAFWPPVCKKQVLEYMEKAEILIKRLLEVLLKGLNVRDFEYDALISSPRINFNYYPKCPNPDLTDGVGPHSDISTITLLLQDGIGGLYVRGGLEADTWIHVPPIDGALVVNIGDVLQIISNGRYKSIEHRVVANGSNNRVSIPVFVNPVPDAVIGPLPELLETGGEVAKYKQLVYSDYFKYFFSKPHEGKKTIEFAMIDSKEE